MTGTSPEEGGVGHQTEPPWPPDQRAAPAAADEEDSTGPHPAGTGNRVPGQGVPGQGVPGQGVPGQGVPGQGVSGDDAAGDLDAGYRDETVTYRDRGYEGTGFQGTGFQGTGYQDTGYQDTGYQDTGYQDSGFRPDNSGFRPGSGYDRGPFGGQSSYRAESSYRGKSGYSGESTYGGASYDYAREGTYSAAAASASGYGQPDSSTSAEEDPVVPPYPAQVPPQQGRTRTETASLDPYAQAPGRVHAAAASPRARRRANLVVARLEPWSVMKFSFLISLVAWVVLFVAVALLYFVLSALGVFDSLQSTLHSVTSSQGSAGFDLSQYVSASKVIGYTMLLGAVNIVLITALSTIGAMIYNLITHVGGGIEVTLKESD